jgi:hypothetical protein
MSIVVKTKNISQQEQWNQVIKKAEAMLSRIEDKAERVRTNIRSLRELRDAGESCPGTVQELDGKRQANG